ncbi:MAG TPA: aconitate hydratase [Proteobacteria bacterium]|nr:aconitate hydratase [Pseudomonadota bacterium]
MNLSVAEKIIKQHLVAGDLTPGEEISLRIDQTLTQDSTGTMAYLQFEAIGVSRVRTELSVSYVDHNTLQVGFENADDHRFLQSIAARYGLHFSRPGNGICHQVHLERFGVPGKTLLGSDSHTPTGGGLGMLAIGAGGLDVALAMAGYPFHLVMPRIVLVRLTGKIAPWATGKDIVLELLRRVTVKGGVGKIFEYGGDGLAQLSVPERATITNMGAETGATTSVFPGDEVTRAFLRAQGRGDSFAPLVADEGAVYDEVIEIDLSQLVPLVARPHMPDRVCPVSELQGLRVDQVAIGSCTNSSYKDLATVAEILRGKTVYPGVSLIISPGSRQVLAMLARKGYLSDLIASGARILENTCGPCIGMGQAPPTGGVSLRTFNRNFEGRCGTKNASVYLASPEVAAATALTGVLTDPRTLGEPVKVALPRRYLINDRLIIPPLEPSRAEGAEIIRGPNIQPLPGREALPSELTGPVLIKLGHDVTTDHILPAGARITALRSNIPAISRYIFSQVDPTFYDRAKEAGGGFIVGGMNYGQGSSREHAALGPMYLGIKAVLALSFARIHRSNLINFGILPLVFLKGEDYDSIQADDRLTIRDVRAQALSEQPVLVVNETQGHRFIVNLTVQEREREVLLAGGLLNYVRETL